MKISLAVEVDRDDNKIYREYIKSRYQQSTIYIYIYIYIYIDGVDSRYIINIEEIEKYSIYGWEDMSYNREEVHCKGGHFYAYFDKSD